MSKICVYKGFCHRKMAHGECFTEGRLNGEACPDYQEPTCPECGHPVNAHTYDGCGYEPAVFCKCLRTRSQAMQGKDYCTSEWREYNCLDKETCPTLSDGSLCTHYKRTPADLQPVLEEQILKIISEYSVCISHMPAREPTQAIMQAIAASSVIKFPTWEQATDEIEDSRFKENRLQTDKETILVRSGARIMYDRLYSMMLSQGCKV